MADVNLQLTVAGQVLNAKIQAGDGTIPLDISRIVTASGRSANPLTLTNVVNPQQQFTILNRNVVGTRAIIEALVTNFGNPAAVPPTPPLTIGYPLSQIGFYAIDPDVGEILYRISQFDNPNWVPSFSERGWEYNPTFNFATGNASTVNIEINPSGLATRSDVWNSVYFSDGDTPDFGVKTFYRLTGDAPYYEPAGDSDLFTNASIAEMRVQQDPSNPAESPFKVILPRTVIQAIFDGETGQPLSEMLDARMPTAFITDIPITPDDYFSSWGLFAIRGGISAPLEVWGFTNATMSEAPSGVTVDINTNTVRVYSATEYAGLSWTVTDYQSGVWLLTATNNTSLILIRR